LANPLGCLLFLLRKKSAAELMAPQAVKIKLAANVFFSPLMIVSTPITFLPSSFVSIFST
jgi:hypothetical protein